VVRDGQESWTSATGAARSGYTIIDLADDWTPYIFEEHRGPTASPCPTATAACSSAWPTTRSTRTASPCRGRKEHLELYGIPPSLGVLRARFLEDEKQKCHEGANLAAMEAVETVGYVAPDKVAQEEKRIARLRSDLEDAAKRTARRRWLSWRPRTPSWNPRSSWSNDGPPRNSP